jgi:hypothetical protein
MIARRNDRVTSKIADLKQNFPCYLEIFERSHLFNTPAQQYSHLRTIRRLRELGSAGVAATDDKFCESLHATLHAWGRGSGRFPGLKRYGEFRRALAARASEIANSTSICSMTRHSTFVK